MNRMVTIVGIVALVIGLLVGYLWWGAGTQRLEKQLTDARVATQAVERQLEAAQTEAQKAAEKVKAVEERLAAVEADLARERAQRAREAGKGRK